MRCPYCGAGIKQNQPHRQILSPKRLRIFEMIKSGGDDGVDVFELEVMLGYNSPVSLRTAVSAINKLIYPIRIKRKNGKYFIAGSSS